LHTVLTYTVNPANADFYKKSLDKLRLKITSIFSQADFEYQFSLSEFILIIIDLELGDTDAITIIKEIKSRHLPQLPYIIVCSPKADDFIQISALNSGADDFIELPVNPLVFESKIKALLKRSRYLNTEPINASFYIDHERYQIRIGKTVHSLPRLEFKMVNLLSSNPNKIFSKDEIATEIWHNKEISSRRTIDIHIRNIRRVLGDDIIKTYRGLGYCLKLFGPVFYLVLIS
jgi:two-component system, OmpR family, alkaline phosphatase synthesis response regulator PhoP